MKKKNILILVLLALLAGIIALFLVMNNVSGTNNKALSDFSVKDTASITKVFMSDMNNNSVKIVKINPGEWIVNDTYPARHDNIVTLFKTLIWIDVREPVPQKHTDQIIALLASTSTKVEIYQKVYLIDLFNSIKLFPREKLTKTFYVGEATADQMGTYMLMDNSTKPFITYMPGFRGFLSSRFTCKENDWRIPRVFDYKLADIKSVEVMFNEAPESSFKIINNGDRSFKLFASAGLTETPIPVYDTLNMLNYMASFENVNYEAIVNHLSKKDSIISSVPIHIISLQTNSGETVTVKTFHKWAIPDDNYEGDKRDLYDRDRLYALINGGADFVLIQYYVFDRLLRPLSYFQAPEK